MARINIEDKLYSDFRFKELCRLTGNEDKALGMLIRFWRIAQKYWADNRKLIPLAVFKKQGLDLVLQAGLAKRRRSGIYSYGAESQFDWLVTKRENGRKGGRPRKVTETETKPNVTENNPLALTLTLAPSPALLKNKEERQVSTEPEPEGSVIGAISPLTQEPKVLKILAERKVPLATQKAWRDAYPDIPWVEQEILKAIAWLTENPAKKKRHFARFMGRWLSRGWDRHTARMPTTKINTTPINLFGESS